MTLSKNEAIASATLSTTNSTEVGLQRQLRHIYNTPHLTPMEVKRLFEPIVRVRELEEELKLRRAQAGIAQNADIGNDILQLLTVFSEENMEEPLARKELRSLVDKIKRRVRSSASFTEGVEAVNELLETTLSAENEELEKPFGEIILDMCVVAADGCDVDDAALQEQLAVDKPAALAARKRLMEGVQQFVVKIARTYQNRGVPLEDLIQEGNIGLIKAINKYDPSKGFALLTYANDWIHQTIRRSCTNAGSVDRYQMRVPCHMYMAIGRVQKNWPILTEELGREPSVDEIAERCSIKVSAAETALEVLSRSSFSLDAVSKKDDSDTAVGDFIEDENAVDPLFATLSRAQQEIVQTAYAKLPEEEQKILHMRLDLEGRGKPYTQEEVCRILGIKKSRMLNLQKKALHKLHAALEKQAINGDFGSATQLH